ncbi:unnamed protein product [Adineta ricciae]|uniref:Uncharacterized protein n=1 Tax=Adineta ricciae TaxID=249248 RepID=A0A816CM28_ADIRI|nr:unnamed protein product [Adineta ricciae]
MPVLLTGNIAYELALSNGTQGIFRELIHDDKEDPSDLKIKSQVFSSNTIYMRKPLYALVEINTSQLETSLDGLRPKLIPIALVRNQLTVSVKQLFGQLFERMQGGEKVSQVIQVTYKAHGLTMNKIIVDLQVPLTTLQVASVYVSLSRVLQVRPSLAQDTELKRLDELDRKTKRECTSSTM